MWVRGAFAHRLQVGRAGKRAFPAPPVQVSGPLGAPGAALVLPGGEVSTGEPKYGEVITALTGCQVERSSRLDGHSGVILGITRGHRTRLVVPSFVRKSKAQVARGICLTPLRRGGGTT